jgi:hypothetical protein
MRKNVLMRIRNDFFQNPISFTIILLFLIFSLYSSLNYSYKVITFNYPLNYGEGIVLSSAIRFSEGKIYLDINQPPYDVDTYPPVYYFFLSLLFPFFGKTLLAGRLLSFLSLVGTSILVFLISYKLGKNYIVSFISAALILSSFPFNLWGNLVRVDTLGLFFLTLGICLLLYAKGIKLLFASLISFFLAFFTRFDFILGIFFFYACVFKFKRQYFFRLCAMGIVTFLTSSVFLIARWSNFFYHVMSPITLSKNEINNTLGVLLILTGFPFFLFTLCFSLFCIVRSKNELYRLFFVYLLFSFIFLLLRIIKVGSDINYFYEFEFLSILSLSIIFSSSKTYFHFLAPSLILISLVSISILSIGFNNSYTCIGEDFDAKLNSISKFFNEVKVLIPSKGWILTEESYFAIPYSDRQLFNDPFISNNIYNHSKILYTYCQNQNFSVAIINFRFRKFTTFYSCLKQNYLLVYNNSCGWEVFLNPYTIK